ncbi:DCC1-like thiol-disulfide oxidoreductase family protein [Streptomyces sp. WMMC500]|uniref:thiol-disulfide oxidoreductase DCC family protein n=1 Tax=Streptomyces sp. WMMC500 TaxID=3015154 RepID=UPI00248B5258|nr:DCC1-like thiol-disulfide oxidoreductase family protein [Streptomyces sp. WMMC500]WBB63099.1 DCC1-like thiol-disulfide oxidoreductase family protein [Streptomyces sp. WMMC500]
MLLLYDGDCGFCTGWADFGRRRFAPEVRIVPWQSVDPAAYGVPEERLLREVVLVEEAEQASEGPGAGSRPGGAMAIAGTLRSGNRAGRLLGRALAARPVRRPAAACYRLVSRNRYRLRFPFLPARSGASCGVDRP